MSIDFFFKKFIIIEYGIIVEVEVGVERGFFIKVEK